MLAIVLGVVAGQPAPCRPVCSPAYVLACCGYYVMGIVLLGLRLSLGEAGEIGLKALPVIIVCVLTALRLVTLISQRLGLSARLGTLIAAGTGICGATAIVALSPSIRQRKMKPPTRWPVSRCLACWRC